MQTHIFSTRVSGCVDIRNHVLGEHGHEGGELGGGALTAAGWREVGVSTHMRVRHLTWGWGWGEGRRVQPEESCKILISETSSALTTSPTRKKKKSHLGDGGHQRRKEKFFSCCPLRVSTTRAHPCALLSNTQPTLGQGEGLTYSQNSMTGEVAFSEVTFREPLVLWNSTQYSTRGSQGRKQEKDHSLSGMARDRGVKL